MWPLLELLGFLILAHSRLMSAVRSSGTMASLTRLGCETQAPAPSSTEAKVSCLTVSTRGGVLSPLLWLMFLN